ncbi:MAG: STAS domain-containing protein [Rhodocyclaceae bacterium]|nr:STAS domain-containing protein [Rhodocyclaceae bacterium]
MSTNQRLLLEDDLTIYHAAAHKARLLEALETHDDVEVDLSKIAEMDTAGVQLLVFLKREAQRLGKRARIVGHSPAVRDVIDFLHLAAWLGDPMVIPSAQGTGA